MEDEGGPSGQNSGSKGNGEGAVRSRWTPKAEQILILESIFNSGMVNPPKDETVRIRKLLEKFGPVGDANVFYWFQNRRSRSRRRQRQMQAATLNHQLQPQPAHQHQQSTNMINMYDSSPPPPPPPFNQHQHQHALVVSPAPPVPTTTTTTTTTPTSFGHIGSSSYGLDDNGLFSLSAQLAFPEIMDHNSIFDTTTNLHYQSPGGGYVTVVINGVATEVPRGPLDLKAMFGEDVMLVHSSGLPLPINEFGFLLQSLQHGESYFLVSRQT